ncbi:hypothetical protein N7519_009723 [Penicillium mononematosum]|uniref:uncharacterized protein n=1 Tax=Penicillium mononematosum TaxID=268346 RepID=UPI002549924D|nr:uncharacterized protein N7519_009723 [Penicillium mononematosum]KAJ6179262.1 hypothetical protein N7519_009723 [Penicillium mononematosum]
MQFSSFLFATLVLAASSVWAQDATDEEAPTCLSVCNEEKFQCLPGMVSKNIVRDGEASNTAPTNDERYATSEGVWLDLNFYLEDTMDS